MRVLRESKYTYLRANFQRNMKWAIALSFVGIPAFILGFYIHTNIALGRVKIPTDYALFLGGLILLSLGLVFLVSALDYLAGIEGEKAVAKALQELDDSYYLINNFTMFGGRGGNIDHIVLGPNGVFAIETKNYSGDVRCEGDNWSKKGKRRLYEIPSVSKQARKNANYLSGIIRRKANIDIPTRPIIVFTNPWMELKIRKATMPVLRLDELAEFVREAPPLTTLADSEIKAICECILGRRYKQGATAK